MGLQGLYRSITLAFSLVSMKICNWVFIFYLPVYILKKKKVPSELVLYFQAVDDISYSFGKNSFSDSAAFYFFIYFFIFLFFLNSIITEQALLSLELK